MTYPRDKEFPKLTVKQADFYRAWKKKQEEKGGKKPKYNEIEGYLYPNACEYVRVLIRKGFLAESLQTPFRKSDAEFPDIGERSANVLRFIKKYIAENGIAPSVKEISGRATPGVTYGAHECIDRLIQNGYIQKTPNISRGIRLTDKAFPERKAQPASPLPDAIAVFAEEIMGVSLPSTETVPSTKLRAKVGDVEMSVNTGTGVTVFRHKDGTRVSLGLPPGDPVHRKAAFADLLWILQGATTK
jgi:hypothetical protein